MRVREERYMGTKFKESLTLRFCKNRVSCLTLILNLEEGILGCTYYIRPEDLPEDSFHRRA